MTATLVRHLLICRALHHTQQEDIITPSLYNKLEAHAISSHLEGYKLLSLPEYTLLEHYPVFTQNYIKDITSTDKKVLSQILNRYETNTRV